MQPQDLADTRHHAQHDLTLIAGFAADDLASATDRARTHALVHGCTECSALRDDLVAIAHATRLLPTSMRAPRDFRITSEQAARLRRTGWLATLLGPFASARSAAKPVATALTTLGLAGVFVATVLPGIAGGAAFIGAPEAAPTSAAGGSAAGPAVGVVASAAPVPQFGPAAASNVPDDKDATTGNAAASDAPIYGQSGGGTGRDLASNPGSNTGSNGSTGSSGIERFDSTASPASILLLGSLALLAAGLVLFGLRFAGRRLR